MKLKIGVMGSASDINEKEKKIAFLIGKEIAKNGCILINGATTGLPDGAAKGAKSENGFVVGISPATNLEEHKKKYGFPTDNIDVIIFTGFGKTGRNILNIRSSDGVIILKGNIGTLNEYTAAFYEAKVIGVLTGIGGIADEIKKLNKVLVNKNGSNVIFDSEPGRLVKRVVDALK